LQMPALDRICRRAAQDADRQNPSECFAARRHRCATEPRGAIVLQPERHQVMIDGKGLETLRYSPASCDTTIVMLHEGLGSIAMWRHFPGQLVKRTGCGVLLYSRYGHGKSQRLSEMRSVDFMHHEAKVVLPELLKCFNIERPLLLGHSDGGS